MRQQQGAGSCPQSLAVQKPLRNGLLEGAEHAPKYARELDVMAESMAVFNSETARRAGTAKELSCSVGTANRG